MDDKDARRLAALCASCCARKELAKCGQCRAYKCKVARASTVAKKQSSSSHASPQPSAQSGVHSASSHGSVQVAQLSARANDSGGSSANASGRSKTEAATSSARRSASKKSSVLDAVASGQSVPAKSSSKKTSQKSSVLDTVASGESVPGKSSSKKTLQTAVQSAPINISEEPVSPVPPSNHLYPDPNGFGEGNGECALPLGIVVDGWDVAKYHDRKGFRSVNVVRALKYLRKAGYKRAVAFVPRSYVEFRSNGKKLADDPCVLKYINERGFLQFTDDKRHYAWRMLTFAKENDYAILTNRWYDENKVRTPKDVDVSPEELNELCSYARDRRMPYTFKRVDIFDMKPIKVD